MFQLLPSCNANLHVEFDRMDLEGSLGRAVNCPAYGGLCNTRQVLCAKET
jgi:hypothetical protein